MLKGILGGYYKQRNNMRRDDVDKLVSATGLVLSIVFLIASGALYYTYQFVHGQVSSQLSSEKITFPAADSKAFTSLPQDSQDAIKPYAGQELTTGAQANVFADKYIAVHLDKIGGGKTYSELSSESMADPSNKELSGKVDTVFRGQMLRGVLLNAYAFDTMAIIAKFAAVGALAASFILAVLSSLGFRHAKKVKSRRKN